MRYELTEEELRILEFLSPKRGLTTKDDVEQFVVAWLELHPGRVKVYTSMGVMAVIVRWPWWRKLWFGWRARRTEEVDRLEAAIRARIPCCVELGVEVV